MLRFGEKALDEFWVYPLIAEIESFWDDLSNWYVRLSRRRFWKSQADTDKTAAYATLYEVLVALSKLMAPIVPFLAEEMYQNLAVEADTTAPSSIFHNKWPIANDTLVDESLEREIAVVRKVVGLGRAARAASNAKTRQPLQELALGLSRVEDRDAVQKHLKLVLDEVNVKAVRFIEGKSELLTHEIKPNYKSLGPRFGKQMPSVAKAISLLDPELCAETVEDDTHVVIKLDGVDQTLNSSDLDVRHHGLEGYEVASEGGIVVGLSLILTDELRTEGKAREIVHAVQNLRRQAGFEVSDRINLCLSGQDVTQILELFESHIAGEVLALTVTEEDPLKSMHVETVIVHGTTVNIGVQQSN